MKVIVEKMCSPDADMSKTIENLYSCKHYFSSLHQSPDWKCSEVGTRIYENKM